jgi:hypothetical protein
VAVALTNFVANYFYFYWIYWWFDNISHFLGGLAMGLFWFYVLRLFFRFGEEVSFMQVLKVVGLIVLVIGIGWEIFEYITGTANPSKGETYWQDTSYDLVDDMLGALVAALIIFKRKFHA